MRPSRLVLRGLTYYWRTNVAVLLGVATAVAVLSGALLIGDSVRGSLRDLIFQRLGATDQVVASARFFREQLAEELRAHPDFASRFTAVCPMVMAQGVVTEPSANRRAGHARVYGVDDRFWQFHGVSSVRGPRAREALISAALAQELDAEPGGTILVRIQRPSEIPLESLFGRKDEVGRTLRLTVRAIVTREMLGEFSLQPQQADVRAVFVPLERLQQELELERRVNALLISARREKSSEVTSASAVSELERLVTSIAQLEDLGLKLRQVDRGGAIAVEADGGLLDDAQARAVQEAVGETSARSQPIFTYLANSLRSGDREIPYSLVTALDLSAVRLKPDTTEPPAPPRGISRSVRLQPDAPVPPIVLNDWAARDLKVAIGDPISMDYYVWEDEGRLATRTADFHVAGVLPTDAIDRDLAPTYPGITESPTLEDWNPPFPIDLRLVRRVDEEYWKTYRTTPKAFIPLDVGQRLWRSRYGALTSIRIVPEPGVPLDRVQQDYALRLRQKIDPLAVTFAVRDVRTEGLEASRGATDFGEYFVYFSFFLVVSALLLAAMFFKLSVEQRAREIGLLRSVGLRPALVRRLFTIDGLLLAIAGSAVGIIGGLGYAALMMAGLRTWWIDAVGTTALTLHISWMSLAAGAVGGLVAATVCIWWTLRGLARVSDRSLLAGQLVDTVGARREVGGSRSVVMASIASAVLGAVLMGGAAAGLVPRTGAFFGAGSALLIACLCLFALRLRRPRRALLGGPGWTRVLRLGARNATYRPGRSIATMTVIASATFMLISVDAFRRGETVDHADRHSGVGGYSLLVESLLPLTYDPDTSQGRETLGLGEQEGIRVEPFRVLPGDDASCLNLYEPKNPRILAPRDSFLAAGRFTFQASLASTDAERANPWLLLNRREPDGAVPVIADANSMTYVLHRNLGEDLMITRGNRPLRLRLVGALDDSILQGELLMSQSHFIELFPEQEGYRFLLIETPPDRTQTVAANLERALADFGADATATADRLAEFHKVENTYLSTFQTLGGLGLLLGTFGLGAVLLRNALERRRELGLLRALGYKPSHFFGMVIAENASLLVSGLVAGTVCALLAMAPIAWERGGRLPVVSLALLLVGVLTVGVLASLAATAATLRSPLMAALRSE